MDSQIERAELNGLSVSLRRRFTGPGGLYNIGNAIGLFAGVGFAIYANHPSGALAVNGAANATREYLIGSSSAVALTLAMLIFFASSECYYRGVHGRKLVSAAMIRHGDWTSGVGALVLGYGLLILGQPILALASGLLHAIGKFGSAFAHHDDLTNPWPQRWRYTTLSSRVPAVVAGVLDLARDSTQVAAGGSAIALAPSMTLIVCYYFWIRADVALLGK